MSHHPARRTLVLLAVALTLLACDTDDTGDTDPGEGDGTTDPGGTGSEPVLRDDPDCFGIEVELGPEPDTADDAPISCGFVEVPLDHDRPDGETIEVAVARFDGRDREAYERPLLVLGGGPGEVMVETFLTEPLFRELFDLGPDLIVVDQRGVGSSVPALDCPEVTETPDDGSPSAEQLDDYVADLQRCRDRLAEEGIDLGGFNHLANAADLDLIRRALGHDHIDLRGTSYGTQVALLAAQMQPDTIGSVVLSSPVDPTLNWVELAPAGVQRAFDEIAEACGTDSSCAEAFGDVDALIDDTVARLDERPEEVTVELPGSEPVQLNIAPAEFLGALSLLFYLPDGPGAVPAMASAAAAGELEPLAELSVALEQQLVGAISVGMQYSMLCTGEGADLSEASLRDGTDGGPVEEYWIPGSVIAGDRMIEVCEAWDVDAVYDPGEVVLDHDVPTLIVSGDLDHVTAPAFGRSVADQLPHSVLIEVPAVGHAPLEALGPCGQQIVGAFLLDPETPPDDTCAMARELAFAGAFG